jgi:hypothetical protein
MAIQKFNFSAIKKRRNRIAAFLSENYVGVTLVGDLIRGMTDGLLHFLPPTVSAPAVFETVRALAGTALDRRKAQEFAWRLAGNIDKLIAGEPVLPWTRQREDEVVPVRVELVIPTRRRDDFGFIFQCRALAGSPCAMLFPQFFSSRSCKVLSRVVGFSNTPWGPHQYGGVAAHFTNLMFFAHIEAARSHERPAFQNISIGSGLLRANKELIEVRCRSKPCPFGYEQACGNCYMGYGECSYAVHPQTFVEQHCRTCDTVSFFNPDEPGFMCINCQRKNNCAIS